MVPPLFLSPGRRSCRPGRRQPCRPRRRSCAAEDAEAVGVQPPWLENRYVAAWIALDDAEEAAPSAFMEQALQLEEIGKQFYLTPEGKEGIACMTDEGEMAWLFPLRGRGNEAAQGGAQGESDVTQGDGEVAAIVKRLHRDVTHKSGVSFSLGYAHASGADRIMDCLELGRAACRRRFAEGKGKVFAPLPEEARAWSGSALQMRRALDYIHERCYDGVTLREVASHVHLSRNYFCHLFKKHTGHNFMDYVIRLRIEQAKRLLKETDAKVYEVAERSGFNDVKYFGKLFKKMTGLSPIEYRDRAWAMPGSPGAEAGHQVREDGA